MQRTQAALRAVQDQDLFTPFELSDLTLSNRIVMAPMTRSRALEGNVPNPLAADYYAQRASAGLIVTEAAQVSPQGVGYVRTPGLHTAEQLAGWTTVTKAEHAAGGKIFARLWHVGRASHPVFHGAPPAAIAAEGEVFTPDGRTKLAAPRALELSELPGVVEQFRRGAEVAKAAGFDGVGINGANGYLLDQFLRHGANRRGDAYGGGVANRARLPIEVAEEVMGVWSPGRVGYRVSPNFSMYSMGDSSTTETFTHLARELDARRLGYLHVMEPIASQTATPAEARVAPALRRAFGGALIVNSGYDGRTGADAVRSGAADLVAFGVLSSRTRTCRGVCARRRRSTRPTSPPSTRARRRAAPTIRPALGSLAALRAVG